jgi:4-amino-4-deoxy-L-arabinose transferase-like glycosyltransferase
MRMMGRGAGSDDSRWTLAVVGLATVVRLAAAVALGPVLRFIDEGIYLDAARRLVGGEGFDAGYANVPGYPVILGALAGPWLENVLVVRCAQAVVGGLATVLIVELGRRTFGRTAAYAAAVGYALDPLLVVTAVLLYPETVGAVVLAAAALAAWIGIERDRVAGSAVAGVLLGVVVQCRPVALVLLPVMTAWAAWAASSSRGRRMLHAGALALACVLSIVPWGVHNMRVHGAIVPAATTGLQSAPVSRADIADRGLVRSLAGRLVDDPVGLARHVAYEFGHFWELYPTRLATDDPRQREALHRADPRLPLDSTFGNVWRDRVSAVASVLELSLALVGLAAVWPRQRVAAVLFLALPIAYGLGFALFVAKLRYRLTVVPFALLFAGAGTAALLSALPTTRQRGVEPSV